MLRDCYTTNRVFVLIALHNSGIRTMEEVNAEISHLQAMAARDAGWIEYDAGGKPDSHLLAIPEVKEAYDHVVAALEAAIKGVAAGDTGRAEPARHPGDLESFSSRT